MCHSFMNVIFALAHVDVDVVLGERSAQSVVLVLNKPYSNTRQALVVTHPFTLLWDRSDRPPPWSSLRVISFGVSEAPSSFINPKEVKNVTQWLPETVTLLTGTVVRWHATVLLWSSKTLILFLLQNLRHEYLDMRSGGTQLTPALSLLLTLL